MKEESAGNIGNIDEDSFDDLNDLIGSKKKNNTEINVF